MECKSLSIICFLAIAKFEDVSQYVFDIIQDVTKKDMSRIHDVAFLPLGNVDGNLIFHNVIGKVSKTNPSMITSFDAIKDHYGFRKPSFVVIVSDLSRLGQKEGNLGLSSQLLKLRPFSESSKFIFISSKPPLMTDIVINDFRTIFANNFILIDFNGKTRSGHSANFFQNISYPIPPEKTDSGVIFENKLKNMKQHAFKVAVIDQVPRINGSYIKKAEKLAIIKSVDSIILTEVVKHCNATIQYRTYFNRSHLYFSRKVNKLLKSGAVDLTLNTLFSPNFQYSDRLFINTFDVNAYCAIVPIPPRKIFLHYILAPFDGYSWMIFLITVIFCSILWHFLKYKISAPYFVFAVISNFLGQSVPMNEKRKMLITLFQLCVFLTFIMGNAYQSLLISLMATSREGIRLKSFDELFKSNYSIKSDMIYYNVLNRSGDFNSFIDRLEAHGNKLNISYQQLSEQNLALIARCDMIEQEMFINKNSNISKYFYMLSEKTMPFYEQFRLADLSPFHKMIQKYFDIFFESGIRQFHTRYLNNKNHLALDERMDQSIKNEDYLLKFQDVYGVFYILLVGYIASFLVFLLEICSQGCLMHAIKNFERKQREKASKKLKGGQKIKVRKIQVETKFS